MLLTIILGLVFVACVVVLYQEGLWGNLIRLVNVTTSAVLATNYYEPLARWFESKQPTYSYVWDFLAIWAVFVLSMAILRTLTDLISRVKVRFLKVADRVGSGFFAAWVGWVMVIFTAFSLHTAPLGRTFLRGSFVPEERAEGGVELYWLGFAQRLSRGTLARGLDEQEQRRAAYGSSSADQTGDEQLAVFDRQGLFIPKYATRRARLQAYAQQYNAIRVREEHLVK